MPQYVAYQKKVVYAFIKLSAKSHSFNILRTMDGLSCPTILQMNIFVTIVLKTSLQVGYPKVNNYEQNTRKHKEH